MSFLTDMPRLIVETVQTIRARVDGAVNAGVDPSDEHFVDTTEGGFFWDTTQPGVIEMARLYDFFSTEVVAATFPQFAWGEWLDEHGITLNLPRKAAVAASGVLTFTATSGTIIAVGTRCATLQTDPTEDPITFVTTNDGTVGSGGTLSLTVVAEEAGFAGNVGGGSVTQLLSPVPNVTAVVNPASMSGGADVESDDRYRERILLEYASPQGSGTIADYIRWALAYPAVGYAAVTPLAFGYGTVQVMITDQENNPVSPGVVAGLQALLDPPVQTTSTNGTTLTLSGTAQTVPVSGTAGFAPTGVFPTTGGTASYTGLTGTSFTGVTGSGTIPAGFTVIQRGRGDGLAPIGAQVYVQTPTTVTVSVSAGITCLAGYSLTGASGTVAIGADIRLAIEAYVNTLPPGADVVLAVVESQIVQVPGVYDVISPQLNGSAANVSISAAQVAHSDDAHITLS